jgi:hypothetical protein
VEVDLVALDGEVPSRAAQALGVEESEEAVLGVASGDVSADGAGGEKLAELGAKAVRP